MEAVLVDVQYQSKVITYSMAEALCYKHLSNRVLPDMHGPRVKVIRYQPEQRFRPSTPSVSNYLAERIDFDRAFRMLDKPHQKVLLAWYGKTELKPEQLAQMWGVDRSTVYRRKHRAVEAFAEVLTKCNWKG